MKLNIFDLRLTTRQHLKGLESSIERKTSLCNGETKRADKAMAERDELRATVERMKRELGEAGLQIEDLKKRLKQSEAQLAAAQHSRIVHNRVLMSVGQTLVDLKKAWKFRLDNPKMNPKQRQENNDTLTSKMAELHANMPKKIPDPIESAK